MILLHPILRRIFLSSDYFDRSLQCNTVITTCVYYYHNICWRGAADGLDFLFDRCQRISFPCISDKQPALKDFTVRMNISRAHYTSRTSCRICFSCSPFVPRTDSYRMTLRKKNKKIHVASIIASFCFLKFRRSYPRRMKCHFCSVTNEYSKSPFLSLGPRRRPDYDFPVINANGRNGFCPGRIKRI